MSVFWTSLVTPKAEIAACTLVSSQYQTSTLLCSEKAADSFRHAVEIWSSPFVRSFLIMELKYLSLAVDLWTASWALKQK